MTTSPELERFTAELPFVLDGFQRDACVALERGHGVLVCAPTGAGKTVVGEFAVHLALAAGRKWGQIVKCGTFEIRSFWEREKPEKRIPELPG